MIEAPARSYRPAPWQAQRFQLWSLLTMLQLYATDFLMVLETMARAKGLFHPANDEETKKLGRLQLGLAMTMLRANAANLPLSQTFLAGVDRLKKKADDQHEIYNVDDLSLLLTELEMNLRNELKSHLFLSLRNEFQTVYEKPLDWYGEHTGAAFQKAVGHMRDCGQCFALEQWTASVFHAMCVLEYGLANLYRRVGAKPKSLDWHHVINAIQGQIAALRNVGKALSPLRKRRLDAYDEAAVQFRHFKNAWRNHVNHGRERYNEAEAKEICDAVRSFMKHLASWKQKKRH